MKAIELHQFGGFHCFCKTYRQSCTIFSNIMHHIFEYHAPYFRISCAISAILVNLFFE